MLNKKKAIAKLNELGSLKTAFSFYCDFFGEKWCVETSHQSGTFHLQIENQNLVTNQSMVNRQQKRQLSTMADRLKTNFKKHPIAFSSFKPAFDQVINEINIGNSFLTNLTFQTPIQTNLSLDEIFQHSSAKYKLLVPNQYVVFSPETFIKIEDEHIFSYPMKGTIDASHYNARDTLLNDPKELAEHVTIVDLIRNDLSLVADKVEVKKFRFLEEIQTNNKRLLQVSSEIKGYLGKDWKSNLGSILSKLIPAGSISGAPKPETVRIIKENERYERGFYTGVCGHYNGHSLDTGVMIRFIKKERDQLFYCSGGGITSFSKAEKEYQEMIDKIYLPL